MPDRAFVEYTRTPLPLENLSRIIREKANSYRTAEPFPHIVLDGFFAAEAILDKVLEEFPSKDQIKWTKYDSYHEVKLASKGESQLGPFTRYLIYHLNSSSFINFLEELTGIKGLIPDPHLEGGGLHQILRGGKLGIHADFNKHLKLNLDRRINFIVYLNKEWKEEYGGHIELWDRTMKRCARKVLPVFNRVLIFDTTDFAFHGHPEPLNCPEDRSRKSLALYYFSNGRPDEKLSADHSTIFKLRPGEKQVRTLKQVVNKFIPPIVHDLRFFLKREK